MSVKHNEVGAIVSREILQALGYAESTLATRRALSLNQYNGIMPAAAAGRSGVVSLDVADAIHALLAQMMPVIESTIVEFEAQGQDDEGQAQIESDMVRVVIERQGGYASVQDCVHDALLLANCWIEVSIKRESRVESLEYPAGLSDDQLDALAQMVGPNQEASLVERADKTVMRVTTTTSKVVIESAPPEEMLYSEDGSTSDIAQSRFVARSQLYTAAALADLGISQTLIDGLADWVPLTQVEIARRGDDRNATYEQSVQSATRTKQLYRCFMQFETGSNQVELREIWVGGAGSNTVLLDRPASAIPWICGSAIPMPHRILGRSIYDLLGEVQTTKTSILRDYVDNLGVMNASRLWANPDEVNMKDLTDGRINGVVRALGPNSVGQLPATDIGQQALAGLGYMDQVRGQRVGAALDFNEVQSQIMSASATAAAGQLAKVEQMSGWFAANVVRTVLKPLYLAVHRLMRMDESAAPVTAKRAGKWESSNPEQWPDRSLTSVNMGMTTVQRAERMQSLSTVISQQMGLMSSGAGGVLVDNTRIYGAMSDWIRAAGLGSPDQYLIDPASAGARQAAQAAAVAAEQKAAAVSGHDLELLNEQHRYELVKAARQHGFDLAQQERELEYKVWSDRLDAELKEAQMMADGVVSMRKLQLDAAKVEPDDSDDGGPGFSDEAGGPGAMMGPVQ